jgi:pimeloyl-ACP methyl ester carboxylesterase
MPLEIPSPSMTFEVALEDGARIRMRRHGNPDGVRLLVTHGNGFAADAYYPYWQSLLSRFDVLVFDFRNHGQNVPVSPSNHNYAQLSRDLERVVQEVRSRLGPRKTAGIFHSMSARTAMKHAIEIGWRWDALMLFDPPDVPPKSHPLYASMAEEYRQSRATRGWVPGEHELMARAVLRPAADGDGYELTCAPENEAAIYAEALTLDLWPKADEFGGPVKLIGCDPNFKGAPATGPANRALGIEGGYDYSFVPNTGHLLQIEKPEECIRLTLEFLGKHGLA